MRIPLAIVVVVTLAAVAGYVAFMRATPDQARRPAPSELGFRLLDRTTIADGLGHAARHHQRLHRTRVERRLARTVSAAWLASLSAGRGAAGPRAAVGEAPVDPAGRRRIALLREFADDLPAATWNSRVVPLVSVASDSPDAAPAYQLRGAVELEFARGGARTRTQRLQVILTIEPRRGGSDARPRGWDVRDVRVEGPSDQLRAYRDPILARASGIDVVSPASRALAARTVARSAALELQRLRRSYPSLAGEGPRSIWLLVDRVQATRALGPTPASARSHAAVAGHHRGAWVDDAGDVAVRLDLVDPTSGAGSRELRHELAHVATRGVRDTAPALLWHGVAALEASRGRAGVFDGPRMDRLREAFGRRQSGVAQLLVAPPARELSSDPSSTEAEAALATVAWIERVRGHGALVRLLATIDAGMAPALAVQRVLGTDARGVEVAVARWLRREVASDGAETGRQEQR